MPTTIEELERVHLRFINVKDDPRLTDIMSKILPNILNIFFEPDLTNVALDHPKIKAIEQILHYLMMRTKNSKQVNPPWALLVDIFNQEPYLMIVQNQTVKRHAANRIYEFIFESFDRITPEADEALIHVLLQTVANDKLRYSDKCRLFLILIQRLSFYVKSSQFDKLSSMISPILTEELKQSFLQLSLYYLVFNMSPQSLQSSLRDTFALGVQEMSQRFKADLKETQTQFLQNYDDIILKVTAIQTLFKSEEVLPLYMVGTLATLNRTKETSEASFKNIMQSVDTKDVSIAERVYKLVFSEMYIYRDFSEREDQEVQLLPAGMQVKLIEYLIKFECSASQHPLNQKLVYHCFFSSLALSLEKIGLQFIKHMIQYNDLKSENNPTVHFLRDALLKLLKDQRFSEESQSYALFLLGDIAMRNYEAVNDDIDIAINTFERLKQRIAVLEQQGFTAIKNDPTASNFIDSLNRFRDCYEEKLKDTNKKGLIVSYVLNSLNKETTTKTNSEIIYLLFLYLIRVDSAGNFNSSVLLHSIILKDHPDFKIKREALRQLDSFNQQIQQVEASNPDKVTPKRILRPFLKDIQIFLHKNHMTYVYDGSPDQLKEYLSFNNTHCSPDFIEKLLEITQFVIRFYKEEQRQQEQLMDFGDMGEVQDRIERLLMMNLNQNFQLIKNDFSSALSLIFEYLGATKDGPAGPLESIGLSFFFRLSQGTVNLHQRVLSLKILIKILRHSDFSQHSQLPYMTDFLDKLQQSIPTSLDKPVDSWSHEVRLNTFFALTLVTLFHNAFKPQIIEHANVVFSSLVDQLVGQAQSLGPNVMEQVKFMSVSLRKIGQQIDLKSAPIIKQGKFEGLIDYLVAFVKRNELDINFRKYVLSNLPGIIKKTHHEFILQKASELQTSMQEVDNADIQEQMGKALAKMNYFAGNITSYAVELQKKVFMKNDASLNLKRNSAIYLYQVVERYGKSQKEIQSMFLDIQRVFLKFLFDRKAYMQDLSSKALSKIYHLGTPEVRTQLVDALSKTLSGEKSAAQEHQEKDENNELLLEFKDNTGTEQKEKLKTYKDLCNIAVELGHRELIYQFLEVHRHLAHYQDIKNAAKGLSSIIMLDEKLRGDLLRIAPKILLLSYDHNNEVKETMKELWSSLIEVEKEEQIINSRWSEIFKEAFDGLNSKEYRRRQSSALALSDLLSQRTWPQIKDKFREVFLTTLGLLDDQKDSVKLAAFQLSKTLKRLTLKLGNIYTNGNVQELEEVLNIVIPMILDDCMKSTMKEVKFFAVDLLFDLIKTSQNHNIMKQLKVPNKYERQLVFNYNSEQKMKEILNKFLDRIIVEVLANVSQMNKAVETINYYEQLAIGQGLSGSSNSKSGKGGISESELNDMRIKYTKESAWGEILKICRDQMTQDTFNKILNDLFNFMFKGHDQITKSSSIAFIDDIILENKLSLITPQNSKKIATKLIEIYSLNSIQTTLQMKESIQNLYATCLGLQIKILKDYPKTLAQLIESLVSLPRELDIIVCLNIYEISKNIPEEMLKTQLIVQPAYPLIYVNRFSANDHRLKTLCRKAHSFLTDHIPNLVESSLIVIFKLIKDWLDSSSYDERVAASQAMTEVSQKLSDEDIRGNAIVQEVVMKLQELIAGKYFNNKEQIVEGFMSIVKIAQLWNNAEFANNYVGNICYKQIEKNLNGGKLGYKNQIIKSQILVLENSKVIQAEVKEAMFEMLARDLRACLQKVSEKAAMIESMDEFEEKREEEKQTLQSALFELDSLPYLISSQKNEAQQTILTEVCKQYYQGTNWIVRNGILKCYLKLLKLNQVTVQTLEFIDHLLQNVSDLGEKYDSNLTIISDITLLFGEKHLRTIPEEPRNKIKTNMANVTQLLLERGTEDLRKNVDLIKNQLI